MASKTEHELHVDSLREEAGLSPPPRTLNAVASRLVDLLDEFFCQLQWGWGIPPGFPRDRFVPGVSPNRDLVVPILQYVADLGFTGDAHRLDEAMSRFYAIRDRSFFVPSPGDDEGWKEYQQQWVTPLKHCAAFLSAVIMDVRSLIMGEDRNVECFVTLLQAASMVNKTKNTLEKRAKKSPMPLPDVEGGGGTAAEWKWSTIRPWLEKEFKRQLPEHFPSDRFIRR
jgi:hypothetical protein